jgi:hypothetical protein
MNASTIPQLNVKSSKITWDSGINAPGQDIIADDIDCNTLDVGSSILGTVKYASGTVLTLLDMGMTEYNGTINTEVDYCIISVPESVQIGSIVRVSVDLYAGAGGTIMRMWLYPFMVKTASAGMFKIDIGNTYVESWTTKTYTMKIRSRNILFTHECGAAVGKFRNLKIKAITTTPGTPAFTDVTAP